MFKVNSYYTIEKRGEKEQRKVKVFKINNKEKPGEFISIAFDFTKQNNDITTTATMSIKGKQVEKVTGSWEEVRDYFHQLINGLNKALVETNSVVMHLKNLP